MRLRELVQDFILICLFCFVFFKGTILAPNPFHSYVDLIYSNELEIKNTAVFHICFIFEYIIELDANGKLKTQLYDKQDSFRPNAV
jgi:hypothetical protein